MIVISDTTQILSLMKGSVSDRRTQRAQGCKTAKGKIYWHGGYFDAGL